MRYIMMNRDYETLWKSLKNILTDHKTMIEKSGVNVGLSSIERYNCIVDVINLMDNFDGAESDNHTLYDVWSELNGTDQR